MDERGKCLWERLRSILERAPILLFLAMFRQYFVYSNFSKYLAFGYMNPQMCYMVILALLFAS